MQCCQLALGHQHTSSAEHGELHASFLKQLSCASASDVQSLLRICPRLQLLLTKGQIQK